MRSITEIYESIVNEETSIQASIWKRIQKTDPGRWIYVDSFDKLKRVRTQSGSVENFIKMYKNIIDDDDLITYHDRKDEGMVIAIKPDGKILNELAYSVNPRTSGYPPIWNDYNEFLEYMEA